MPKVIIINIPMMYHCCRSLVFSGTVHWFEGRQASPDEVHSSG